MEQQLIINISGKPFVFFNAPQRLACRSQRVLDAPSIKTVEALEDALQRYKGFQVTQIIVREDDFVLNNDILNAINAPLVTLHVTSDADGEWDFIPYDADETNSSN